MEPKKLMNIFLAAVFALGFANVVSIEALAADETPKLIWEGSSHARQTGGNAFCSANTQAIEASAGAEGVTPSATYAEFDLIKEISNKNPIGYLKCADRLDDQCDTPKGILGQFAIAFVDDIMQSVTNAYADMQASPTPICGSIISNDGAETKACSKSGNEVSVMHLLLHPFVPEGGDANKAGSNVYQVAPKNAADLSAGFLAVQVPAVQDEPADFTGAQDLRVLLGGTPDRVVNGDPINGITGLIDSRNVEQWVGLKSIEAVTGLVDAASKAKEELVAAKAAAGTELTQLQTKLNTVDTRAQALRRQINAYITEIDDKSRVKKSQATEMMTDLRDDRWNGYQGVEQSLQEAEIEAGELRAKQSELQNAIAGLDLLLSSENANTNSITFEGQLAAEYPTDPNFFFIRVINGTPQVTFKYWVHFRKQQGCSPAA